MKSTAIYLLGVVLIVVCWQAPESFAQAASDNANDATYTVDGWQTGDNGGLGLGAWTLATIGAAGHFIGSSANNAGGGSGDIDVNGNSWGMWASSGGVSEAARDLPYPLSTTTELSIDMDNGWIETDGTVGIGLRNSSDENLVEFYFRAGEADYKINGLGGEVGTNVGFTGDGLTVKFAMTGPASADVTVASATTINIDLLNPGGGQAVERIRLFNAGAGGGLGGAERDAFFNNIEVIEAAPTKDWMLY
jgi:hypothetical protein